MSNDDAYANAAHIDGAEAYPRRWQEAAASLRAATAGEVHRRYGSARRQRYDLFLPEGEAHGTAVFVHGGYWRTLDKSVWSHLAAGPLARGWAVAMPSYTLAPAARIPEITSEIAAFLTHLADERPGPLRLAGHSAGGHLVARMLCPGVLPPQVLERVEACVPISPVADLRPLIDTEMNADFRLDTETAEAESPALLPREGAARVTVWVGADERPAFRDQARWLAQAWNVPLVVEPARHHFDVVDGLETAESALTEALLG